MRIQHNIMAMNAYRNYSNNANALSKNLEKLSSGYKINTAADDAAGLAISEKMRAQIQGLKAAQNNVKDGQSLVKTAEGAMQEIQNMMDRMVYLAEQSANGTYDNEVDRANLQKEIVALKDEINRIADSANFNGVKLLDGSLDAKGTSGNIDIGGVKNTVVLATRAKYQTKTGFAATPADKDEFTVNVALDNGTSYSVDIKVALEDSTTATASAAGKKDLVFRDADGNELLRKAGSATANGAGAANDAAQAAVAALQKSDLAKNFSITQSNAKIVFEALEVGKTDVPAIKSIDLTGTIAGTDAVTPDMPEVVTAGKDQGYYIAESDITLYDGKNFDDAVFTINGNKFVVVTFNNTAADTTAAYLKATEGLGADVTVLVAKDGNKGFDGDANWTQNKAKIEEVTGLTVSSNAAGEGAATAAAGIILRAGNGTGGLQLQIGDTSDSYNHLTVSVKDMHTKSLGIDGIDIGTQAGAQAAIDVVKNAVNIVSSVRGDLGAISNRLSHTAQNLSIMTENIQDAESTIRDTDIAEEMMAYTKNSILVQSAQAMLAQANQIPQGVLQLLG